MVCPSKLLYACHTFKQFHYSIHPEQTLKNLRHSELSSTATKEVFLKMFDPQMKGKDTKTVAKELGVVQENDLGALEAIVDTVLAKPETQKAQEDFRNGEEKVIGFLVGQVMKESHGKANPSAVQEILRKKPSN